MADLKLAEIAARISAHLKRFEADSEINKPLIEGRDLSFYYHAWASASGPRVFVTYVAYQGPCSLTKTQALEYLTGLDAGFVGRHFEYFRRPTSIEKGDANG